MLHIKCMDYHGTLDHLPPTLTTMASFPAAMAEPTHVSLQRVDAMFQPIVGALSRRGL